MLGGRSVWDIRRCSSGRFCRGLSWLIARFESAVIPFWRDDRKMFQMTFTSTGYQNEPRRVTPKVRGALI